MNVAGSREVLRVLHVSVFEEFYRKNEISTMFDNFKGHHRIIQNNTFLMIPFSLYIK